MIGSKGWQYRRATRTCPVSDLGAFVARALDKFPPWDNQRLGSLMRSIKVADPANNSDPILQNKTAEPAVV